MKDPAASSTASAKRRHVDSIVAVLARHAQRATYGAVGGVVGLPARSVMSGCARTPAKFLRCLREGGRAYRLRRIRMRSRAEVARRRHRHRDGALPLAGPAHL